MCTDEVTGLSMALLTAYVHEPHKVTDQQKQEIRDAARNYPHIKAQLEALERHKPFLAHLGRAA